MSKAVKIKICKTMVKPAAVFGSETWAVRVMDMKRLGAWERKILRRINGPMEQQGLWRIRTDQEMRELYKHLDRVANIKTRFERTGHVVRIDQGRIV